MKKYFYYFVLFIGCQVLAQTELNYYLPQNISYNSAIPTPQSVIGFEVGEWHVSHDKLVQYMYTLADASDRITIEKRGETYEKRPILLLTITSPKNHASIEKIRTEHLQLSLATQSNSVNTSEMPLVVYQGFSIHGNEPSGANAGMLLAYYLAAAQGDEIETLLENTIILFDPSFNPDGLQRFSTWANMHKNQQLTSDSNDREYAEAWPRGRTNHYWFDLNRDWLVTQLPESQARIKTFHKWKPNILTDHHEMGTNSSFFFQPGVPSRKHPLTPDLNQKLTAQIGEYHAKAFDKIGSLYFTEENYDDFYYGKGSTFPDINGGIGILFEQASSRGHLQESDNGLLSFPFTIRNQFTAGLSTLEAGKHMRKELLDYQQNFYKQAQNEIDKSKIKAIIVGDAYDRSKMMHFSEMLKRQHIKFNALKETTKIGAKNYKKENSIVIPTNQPNYKIIQAMFDQRTSFTDSLFYDISAWTLPMAFDIDYNYVSNYNQMGEEIDEITPIQGTVSAKSNYAYIMKWDDYYAPKALHKILSRGIRAKVAMKPFTLEGASYSYGSIMVPVQNQHVSPDELYSFLKNVSKDSGVDVTAVSTGLTEGIDLGSSNFKTLHKASVGILIGDGIASYDAGEIWHLLDTRYEIPVAKLDIKDIKRMDLSKYSVLILPNAYGNSINGIQDHLKSYVQNGGKLIGYGNSVTWLATSNLIKLDFNKSKPTTKNVPFDQRSELRGAQVIGGAIFEAQVDKTHPINYGYHDDHIALFRNTTVFVKPDSISNYKNAIQYTKSPLLSGYISKENLKAISETLPFKVSRLGQGKVMIFTDNTNFRAFWYGTNKLLMNAIFFGEFM